MSPADTDAFEAALAAIPESQIKAFVRAWGKRATSDFRDALVAHAARSIPAWKAPCSDLSLVADAEALVATARHRTLEPRSIDDVLRRAGSAFVAGDSMSARRAFEIVLRPLWNGDISLPGIDEFPDEVLTTSTYDVCSRLLVATYETTSGDERVGAMVDAVELVDQAQQALMPIRRMEDAAIRPLDGFETFLPLWLERLRASPPRVSESQTIDLIREATLRVEGVDGLGRIARASKTQEAYRSWCSALRASQSWPELLAAVREASALSTSAWETASWQDEAALLCAKLGQSDLVRPHLAAALDARPTVDRLLRLIDDGVPAGEVLRQRAQALRRSGKYSSPAIVGVLQLLAGEYAAAAEVLAVASGTGWSTEGHPGHMVFASIVLLIGGKAPAGSVREEACSPIETVANAIGESIPAPLLASLFDRCEATGRVPVDGLLDALRTAAWRRIDDVTSTTHRSRYAHGARLAVCVAELQNQFGDHAGAAAWLDRVRRETKSWPMFQAELAEAMKKAGVKAGR